MSFHGLIRKFHLPDYPRDHPPIEVPTPSDANRYPPYQPPVLPPPPPLLNFIDRVKDNWVAPRTQTLEKSSREKLRMRIEIDADTLASRWDTIHGEAGLCNAIMDSTHAMMQMRLEIEYGDYLARSLVKVKEGSFDEATYGKLAWRSLNWQGIARQIKHEEEREPGLKYGRGVFLSLPVHKDIDHAAHTLQIDSEQIKYEIVAYAERNQLCHVGIGRMIEECRWQDLAEQICKDLRYLFIVFQNNPHEQIRMQKCITALKNEFFDECFEYNGEVLWMMNEKAERALRRRIARLKAQLVPQSPAPEPGAVVWKKWFRC